MPTTERPQIFNESIRVFDNFLLPQHLEQVRQSALSAGFGTWSPDFKTVLKRNRFQGVGYFGRHDLVIRALVGRTGRAAVVRDQKFRLTGVHDSDPSHVHSDNSMGDFTAILYLTPNIDERSGTAFYEYRPNPEFARLVNGLEYMPSAEEMFNQAWGDRLNRDMEGENPETSKLWQRTDFVHGKFNRCLIFPSERFHCRMPLEGVGETQDTARLIWVAHFYLL